MEFPNHKGDPTEAPADLYQNVAVFEEGLIVWSRRGKLHQVRYGLQVETFDTGDKGLTEYYACCEFASCVRHHAECEGLLD